MTRERVINRVKTAFEMWEDEWCVGDWSEEYEARDIAIAVLEKYQWTPVSKKLPEEDGEYLCWEWRGFYYVDSFNGGEWSLAKEANAKCIAWMPLPEPYMEDEE